MDAEGVSLPLIHKHLMMPWNDLRKGDCCRSFETTSDGYYCKICDFFVHKKCCELPESIEHLSHPEHSLRLQSKPGYYCSLCGTIVESTYRCDKCDFDLDLHCAKHPPPEVIDVPETHHHKLTLLKELVEFVCAANCGKIGEGFPYKCHECDLAFHLDCVWHPSEAKHPSEVNHSYHPLHPLKLITGQPPDYSDGRCRLCGRKVDRSFYHCSSCNFTLDMRCVLNPPAQSLIDLKAHDHQLTLLPRFDDFTCSACGMMGDRSPYVCFQCGFMIHHECLGLPRVININRHNHRVHRTSILGVVDSMCGFCRQKVDWTFGGYSCQRCPVYVVHSTCATRNDVWNGQELEGVPEEEEEDIEPYVVNDDKTIQHFSHKEHDLRRLNVNGLLWEENRRCNACTHPISLQSFYGCMDCEFILHQSCAELPKKIWHVLHNERLTLVTSDVKLFTCGGCWSVSNGFKYEHGDKKLDVRCASISEPFVHPSHPHHPLYYIPTNRDEICNGCNVSASPALRCIEDACGFVLDFRCATLPHVVKHRVNDYPLLLCYGENDARGKYWCDICEKETNPATWFYTCKDYHASFHTECVLGDFPGLMPRSTIKFLDRTYEVVLNNSVSRPLCMACKSRCVHPIILKVPGTSHAYLCSAGCEYDYYISSQK